MDTTKANLSRAMKLNKKLDNLYKQENYLKTRLKSKGLYINIQAKGPEASSKKDNKKFY